MAERARATPPRATHRAAFIATLVYTAAVVIFPAYLSEQTCRTGLTHDTPFLTLAHNWLSCHIREDHLDVGAYGSWLVGTLLIPLLFWAYRAFAAQETVAEEQRRAVFRATIPQQHERFETLAGRIGQALAEDRGQADAAPNRSGYHGISGDTIAAVHAMITHGLRTNSVELKATLRRTGWTEEYVAEGQAFVAALRRFDLPAYSGGPWRDLLATLEKI